MSRGDRNPEYWPLSATNLPGGKGMTDSISRSNGHRWLRTAMPAGIAVLLAVGVTAGPALAATPAAAPAGLTTSLVAPAAQHHAAADHRARGPAG